MLIINDSVLVSDAVVREHFVCQLESCQGACCWEGDFGAPLEEDERAVLEEIYPFVLPYLRPEGIAAIEKNGKYVYEDENRRYATTLVNGGACAYMMIDQNGIAKCGIEQAYNDGVIDFKKPISCHLYPIRIQKLSNCDALNYDQWDICSAACTNGERLRVPIYRFVKDALIRRYGEAFYEELEAAATYYLENE